ncbi:MULTISPECIES: Bug family tripartite tricarboxylate transporter substrate binding protein [Ramlibacter]|uniref:Tripartite tricarboxylate transporter substrate binding protein n=1 Tax=Ramlibacter pinisoli TaxID=2682844 RepID=A0A6N8ISS6_9BURK|nr:MULTISPECIES: tripartite tricarboxylate transporter substrate binding protein [Ramlibacter]MBA2965014.1 tripartite tricarboxylate transporter substrate binding protein [Ramlibacter sp. CGMCC 1.13660]MVQ29979.1 tripartite tricarboxylate transporter substrate binding protein [Ramlibacter pinisoli]
MKVAARIAVVLAMLLSLAAHAQPYPSRPVTMIVPFPPGGAAHPIGRLLANAMSKSLGQNVVVDTKAGAGGAIGHAYTARQAPNGYTIMFTASSIVTIPVADEVNGRQPTYRMSDFTPIALVAADPQVLLVPVGSPWKTLADLLADAKARPGKIAYSSAGVYGTSHTSVEMFAQAAGIKLLHVPYQGAGPSILALLGGEVQLTAVTPAVGLPHIKAGKVRALASWGGTRLSNVADIPTMKELGIDAEFYSWVALFAPAGLPSDVAETLRKSVRQAVQDQEFLMGMAALTTEVNLQEGAQFEAFLERDSRRLGEAIRRIGKTE